MYYHSDTPSMAMYNGIKLISPLEISIYGDITSLGYDSSEFMFTCEYKGLVVVVAQES